MAFFKARMFKAWHFAARMFRIRANAVGPLINYQAVTLRAGGFEAVRTRTAGFEAVSIKH